MRVPLSWLREFTPVEEPADRIADALSFLGLVVEASEAVPSPFDGIVVARVLATRPHPSADRVHLVDVDAGDGEARQVVCGAFNMKEGDLVPLATLGAVMPNGMEIGRRKLRGEWSNGMLCSAPELGVGPEGPSPAIFVFAPGSVSPGQPVAEAFGFGADVVFDLEISPNRGDCFSVVGVARDLAAGLGLPFSISEPPHFVAGDIEAPVIKVDPAAFELCPRFTGTVVEGVGEASVSPLVRRRLTLAGMRPISPVVDASNYVMLELGQPNHPYDLSRLRGRGLGVRRGRSGERLVTLDGVERQLCPDDIVISDAEGTAVGLGGIMGGAGAEISSTTTTVLLEAANFDPLAISATGSRLGLLSEARTRFERGVDPELALRAVDRFVELLGPGVRRGPTVDARQGLPAPLEVPFRASRANAVLGTSLSEQQCASLLGRLGFEPVHRDEPGRDGLGGPLVFRVPTWRPDCTREVDLVEEVARIHGYGNIERTLPPRPSKPCGLAEWQRARRSVRVVLAGTGASEAWSSTFLSKRDLELAGLGTAGAVAVENPLDSSQSILRTSLLPGLLRAARSNRERQAGALSLFEVGNVFAVPAALEARVTGGQVPRGAAAEAESLGPSSGAGGGLVYRAVKGIVEWEQLGMVAVGSGVDAGYGARAWEVLAGALRLSAPALVAAPMEGAPIFGALAVTGALHPGRRAVMTVAGRSVGVLGELAPEVAARSGLVGRVAVLLADLGRLLSHPPRPWLAHGVSKYPAVDLDMAFSVAEVVAAADVHLTVTDVAGDLAEDVVLFEVWRDSSLGEGRRSLNFRARLRAADRTLTDDEVANVRERVAKAVAERHEGQLRGR